MQVVQFDFFKSEEESELEALGKRVEAIGVSSNKVRKSLYARNNELEKRCLELETRLEIIEKNICRGKNE